MTDPVSVLKDYGPWAAMLAVWFSFVHAGVFSKSDSVSFERMRSWLREDQPSVVYFKLLAALLDWLAQWIGDADRLTRNRTRLAVPLKRLFGRNPWTAESYAVCLLLTLLYPLFGLLGFWVWSGRGALGDWVLLPPAELWLRVLIVAGLVFLLYAIWRGYCAGSWRSRGVWFAVALADIVALNASNLSVTLTVTFAAGVGVLAAFASVACVAGAGRLGSAVAAGFILVNGLIISSAVYPDSVVGVFSLSLIGVLLLVLMFLGHGAGRSGLCQMLFWPTMVGILLIAFRLVPEIGDLGDSWDETQLVLMGLVPLANAPLDWLSLGVTRGLLHAIRDRLHAPAIALFWAIADLLLALVFLALVAAATVAAIALANRMVVDGGGAALVDLDVLLSDIGKNPGDPAFFWIYLMLLTTLVPTILHAFVAALVFVNLVGRLPPLRHWRERAAADLDQDVHQRWGATIYLTLVPAAAVVLAYTLVLLLLRVLSDERVIGSLITGLQLLADSIQS